MFEIIKNQWKLFSDFYKEKNNKKILWLIIAFILLNTGKVAAFNLICINIYTLHHILYKFFYTLVFVTFIWLIIFSSKRRGLAITFYVIQLLYCCINFMYYIFFNRFLHIMQWFTLFFEATDVAKNFQIPIDVKLLIELIDMPVFVYLMLKYKSVHKSRQSLKAIARSAIIASVAIILLMEVRNIATNNTIQHYLDANYTGESQIVLRYGTLMNNITDLITTSNEKAIISKLKYGREISNTANPNTEDTANQKTKFAAALNAEETKNPNIFIIQVESMDSSIIDETYNGSFVTPYLNSLSKNSIYYPYMLSYHLGGGTSDIDFTINNSVEPLSNFPAIKLASYDFINSLPNQLKKGGYYNVAFHGNEKTYYGRETAFPKMGYDDFFDQTRTKLKSAGWGASDGDVMNFALNKMKTFKEPFLSYIITMTSHTAFTNVDFTGYKNDRYNGIKSDMVKQYYKSLSYVDECIKNYVEEVKKNFPNSYILIYGDHTPAIFEQPYKQASLSIDQFYLEFTPLIIITPDSIQYTETKACVSLLDIEPTILNASGIEFNIRSDGMNLLNCDGRGNPIPYLGSLQNREELFKLIDNYMKN